jgi:hypothetical protein
MPSYEMQISHSDMHSIAHVQARVPVQLVCTCCVVQPLPLPICPTLLTLPVCHAVNRRVEAAAEYQLVGLTVKGQNHDDDSDGGHVVPAGSCSTASGSGGGSCNGSDCGDGSDAEPDSPGRHSAVEVRLDMPDDQR